jgi:hypothetical protein
MQVHELQLPAYLMVKKLTHQNKSQCQLHSSNLWSKQSVTAQARQCHQEIVKTRNAHIFATATTHYETRGAEGDIHSTESPKLKDKSAGSKL